MLTIGWELYDQLFIVLLSSSVLALNGSLVLVSKHLRTHAVSLVLLVVRLQALSDAAVLLWTYLRQLYIKSKTSQMVFFLFLRNGLVIRGWVINLTKQHMPETLKTHNYHEKSILES